MLHPSRRPRARRAGIVLAAGAVLAAAPAGAQASAVNAVNLGTAAPFVALGGSTVTNTGPSVLNGDLGVAPGTALVGFGLPAVVNGATHVNDGVAGTAQNDLTTAYNVAAGQPITADLTGQDLGGLTLTTGAYRYASSAQLTGQLTLDAQGDPGAQFVFEIGSTLTTASASSVRLVNGASPCNVFWQVGSSATLGTTTAFEGNVMALTSITLNTGASVEGRVLARNGAVTMDDNLLDASTCNAAAPVPTATPTASASPSATPSPSASASATATATATATPTTIVAVTPVPGGQPGSPSTPPASPGDKLPPESRTRVPTRKGTAKLTPRLPLSRCTTGFRAAVRGRMIKRVVFTLAGRRIADRTGKRFHVYVRPVAGSHGHLKANVAFKDATPSKTMRFTYRACAAAVLHPALGPSQFTG